MDSQAYTGCCWRQLTQHQFRPWRDRENGEFSFSWGETISFGIDTFELGSVRGNSLTIALSATELGDEVRGANID